MISVLTGDNYHLLKAELSQRIDKFVDEYSDLGLEKIDCEEAEYDKTREALESLPFLASKKLVVLTKPLDNKDFNEHAAQMLENVSPDIDVIIVQPKADKRLSSYKYLKKNCEVIEFNKLEGSALSKWLVEFASSQGGELSISDANYLMSRVGSDQQLLTNELLKLINFNQKVDKQAIDQLTEPTPQSTTFELLDAAMSGNIQRLTEIYQEQMQLKVEPLQILGLLAWQLHILALVKVSPNQDNYVIAKEAKLNPYVVQKTQAIARRMSLSSIKELIARTLELDQRIKSKSINPSDALLDLLLTANK